MRILVEKYGSGFVWSIVDKAETGKTKETCRHVYRYGTKIHSTEIQAIDSAQDFISGFIGIQKYF